MGECGNISLVISISLCCVYIKVSKYTCCYYLSMSIFKEYTYIHHICILWGVVDQSLGPVPLRQDHCLGTSGTVSRIKSPRQAQGISIEPWHG